MANLLVTGAGSGIGYYMAEQLLRDGNRVAVLDQNTEELKEMSERYPGQMLYFTCDVREEAEVCFCAGRALEALEKCLDLEYRRCGITFHLFHPPLTRTASAAQLPVPGEFMASPERVGQGLARRIYSGKFVICHSRLQAFQMKLCYLWPRAMGRLLCRMTERAAKL